MSLQHNTYPPPAFLFLPPSFVRGKFIHYQVGNFKGLLLGIFYTFNTYIFIIEVVKMKSSYKEKLLFHLNEFYNDIKESLSKSFIEKYKNFLSNLESSLKYTIICLGTFNTGKSTFINRFFLENDLLPDTSTPKPVKIQYGNTNIKIFLYNHKIVSKELKNINLKHLFEQEKNAKFFEIYINNQFLKKGFMIIDTQGLNKLREENEESLFNFLELSDCILYFINATQPWQMYDKEFLEKYVLRKKDYDKIVFIVNFWDMIKEEEKDDVLNYIKQNIRKSLDKLESYLGEDLQIPEVIPISVKNEKNFSYLKQVLADYFNSKEEKEIILIKLKRFKNYVQEAKELIKEKINLIEKQQIERKIEFLTTKKELFCKNKENYCSSINDEVLKLLEQWIINLCDISNEIINENANLSLEEIKRKIFIKKEKIDNILKKFYKGIENIIFQQLINLGIKPSKLINGENIIPYFDLKKAEFSEDFLSQLNSISLTFKNLTENLIFMKCKDNINLQKDISKLAKIISNHIYSEILNEIDYQISETNHLKELKSDNIISKYESLLKKLDNYLNLKLPQDKKSFIKELLERGESKRVEFKSSLRYDLRKKEKNVELEKAVLKTIIGFLNTNGGILLIGVSDDKKILGIENDLKLFSEKKRNIDYYEQSLINLINDKIGGEFTKWINISFEKIDDKWVCIVEVERSNIPAFYEENIFYIREGNTTRELPIKKAHIYINEHFGG